MHILRAHNFLVAMATLLTHAVMRSTSALNFSLRAVGTHGVCLTDGCALLSTCRWTVPGPSRILLHGIKQAHPLFQPF